MPKPKRTTEDLEAELAALEAELAALEGRPPPKPAPKRAPEPETAPAAPRKRFGWGPGKRTAPEDATPAEAPPADAPAAQEPPAPAGAGRRLPKIPFPLGRKRSAAAEEAHETEAAAASPPAPPEPPARRLELAPPLPPGGDPAHWRPRDGAWVREVPEHAPVVVRRLLDEADQVVREEPATPADLDEVAGVKAERGIGKLLGGRALRLPRLGRKDA